MDGRAGGKNGGRDMSMGKLIVISGASGVGKGTVLGIMMKKRKDLYYNDCSGSSPCDHANGGCTVTIF